MAVPPVVDLGSQGSNTPIMDEGKEDVSDPLSSLTALSVNLDTYATDIPSFLNHLLAPHLPVPPPGAPTPIPDLDKLDKVLGDLLTRLSLLSQDTSSALEQSIHDISRTVPRLTYDLQFMRESALSLESSLSVVQSHVRSPTSENAPGDTEQGKTHASLEKLAHLDKLKVRMESARDVLREAESWSTLEREITGLISTSSWSKAGNRLAEAGKSMVVFQSTPGEYESRRTLLVSLQNQLEGALATELQGYLASGNTDEITKLRHVFELIERSTEFKDYYLAAKRKPLVEQWSKAVILDATTHVVPEEGEEATKFNTFLPKFYASVLAALNVERNLIPLVFPPSSAPQILATLFQTTIDALSPSLQSRLSALADHHGPNVLPEIIRAYKSTQELGLAVQGILDAMAFNTQGNVLSGESTSSPISSVPSPITATSEPRTPKHRVSRRFSRPPAFADAPPTASPAEWETTLYEPFLDLQCSYPSLERRFLAHILRTEPSLSVVQTKGDASRALLDRAQVAFGFADQAIGRCLAFTHGYGAKGLVDALGGFFEDFMESQGDRVLAPSRVKAASKDGKDELDLESLDYSTEDWGAFQLGLHVLSACRGIRDRLSAFEGRLHSALTQIEQISKIQPSDPSTFHLTDTTHGAITLLQQSTLNSAELHRLLGTISSGQTTPLEPARDALAAFTGQAQTFLQDIILSPLRSQLETYPTLSVWSQPDKTQKKGELRVPTFSLSPTDTVARVSEGLLNLLRVFEVYAQDDALGFSLDTLPFVEPEMLAEVSAQGPPGPETVLSIWVSSLSLTLLSQLTKSILPKFPSLSNLSSAQLSSDLGYLSNAVRALDVEWDELERWRDATGIETEAEFESKLADAGDDATWKRVALLRGWKRE